MAEFFKVVPPEKVFEELERFARAGIESIALDDALFRVLAVDIVAAEDLPMGPRSVMDGHAVRAADTFGASESIPALLRVAYEVQMGALPDFSLSAGQAAPIPTGGFLPQGADAVVMIEYTQTLGDGTVEIMRPVTVGENVLGRAEDVACGQTMIRAGRRLGPRELGLAAGLGISRVEVFRKPRVAIHSTGNEIVPVNQPPAPGQVRDMNLHTVSALVRAAGAEVLSGAVVPDDPQLLRQAFEQGLAAADVVVFSGGSSVGERDHIVEVINALPDSRLLAHGVAINPGKPMLLASVAGKPVFGLPGHPVSAMITAQVFLAPFLNYLQGEPLRRSPAGHRVAAKLATSVHKAHGREEYVRVALEPGAAGYIANPVFGKSSMMSTMVKADGFFVLPIHAEGIAQGEIVDVLLFGNDF